MTTSAEWAEKLSGHVPDDRPKQRFLIEWGFRDEVLIKDVIEATDIDAALKEADRMAEDLWASNKTFAARRYEAP